ncbi:MAG: Gfo/Idh/MocA family protein [Hyphomicrobiaceae bacterium]
MAAEPVPLVIMGGGRWGRVWATVVSQARGTGQDVTLVARSNTDETRSWVDNQIGIQNLKVYKSLEEALANKPPSGAAIVATRARDHVADATAAMNSGLDVLVEKPLSDIATRGMELVSVARRANRLLTIGTEFAFLPVFHSFARTICGDAGITTARLTWDDPAGELRHGELKRVHREIGVLIDLMPHAYSIFRIFSGNSTLMITDFDQDIEKESGHIQLQDETGARYQLRCSKRSAMRKRLLEVEGPQQTVRIDFRTKHPKVVVDGESMSIPVTSQMTSTLRLELGAFLSERAGAIGSSPISDSIPELLALQAVLEG